VARRGGKIYMSLPESQIRSLQAEENLLTAARNSGKINMNLPESQIRSLQAEENLRTAARNAGKINMSLPESQIRSLQVMDQSDTDIRRQAMAHVQGRSVNDQAERDTAKSSITFAVSEVDKHLDVMRWEEFEEAAKILDDYSDKSTIASIVKDKPPRKEMTRVKQQVRQRLKEVIDDLEYRQTTSKRTQWRTSNPGAFSHCKTTHTLDTTIKRHLLLTHTHKLKLKIISGLSIKDAQTFRCQLQDSHIKVISQKKSQV